MKETWEDLEKLFPHDSRSNTGSEQAKFLYEYSLATSGNGEIVEIGTNIGESAIALAFGQKQKSGSPIYTVDIYSNNEFKKNIDKAGVGEYVQQIVQSSKIAAKNWTKPIELLFIDGDHSYVGASTDIRSWAPHVQTGGFLILDDYPGHYGSSEVWRAAYKHIHSDPRTWRVISDRNPLRLIVFEKLDPGFTKAPLKSFWYWRHRDLRSLFFLIFPRLSHFIIQRMKDRRENI